MFLDIDYALPRGLSRMQFKAMGTTVTVLLPDRYIGIGGELVQQLFEHWEQTLSRFRPESELSHLNAAAGKQAFVSELLFSVLQAALNAAHATNGLYDPTLLAQLKSLGYDRTFEEVASQQPATSYASQAGGAWREIRLDEVVRGVRMPANVQLDFGGIAKGMAVDVAIEQLRLAGIQPALVNAGGDLRMLGLPEGAEEWSIAVPGKEMSWSMPITQGAVATSGIERRNWRQGQAQRHHLLDPRTGLPAKNDLWSVTAVAGSCMQAEVAAKVAFILGSEDGKRFLQEQHLAGLLVHQDGRWEGNVGWPEHLMRRLS